MRAAAIVALALCAAVAPVRAQTQSFVAAGPGAAIAGFATQVVPMMPGDPFTLVNADISLHGIRSEAVGSDDRPWCGPLNPGPESPTNPRRYPRGSCPLFWSDRAAPLGGTRPVLGTAALQFDRAYAFVCTVFASMHGVVITVPSDGGGAE